MFTLYRMALASARKLYREGLRSHTRMVISVTEPRGVLPIMAYKGGGGGSKRKEYLGISLVEVWGREICQLSLQNSQ